MHLSPVPFACPPSCLRRSPACSVSTKKDGFYFIGVTGSKGGDAGAFKLNIDNTAAAT